MAAANAMNLEHFVTTPTPSALAGNHRIIHAEARALTRITGAHGALWSPEAEQPESLEVRAEWCGAAPANMRSRVDEVRARLATVTIVDDVAVARLEAAGWTCLPPGTAADPPAEPEAPKVSP